MESKASQRARNQSYYRRNRAKEKRRALVRYHANKRKLDRKKLRLYNAEYRKTHPRKPRTPEQRERQSRLRRQRYASDAAFRAKERSQARDWAKKNPDKKFAQRLRAVGLSPAEHADLLRRQNGMCAICETAKLTGRRSRLYVDHCHATGKVRGILCHHCNFGLGQFKDNPELLIKAASYLRNGSSGATSMTSSAP